MIKLIDDTFMTIVDMLKSALVPILIVVSILTAFKILKNYTKYGKKIFSPFKKHNEIDIQKKSLEISISNLNGYYKIVDLNEEMFILILECGIYIIETFKYNGIVSGNIDNKNLVFKANTESEEKIKNPIYNIKKEMGKLKAIISEEINGYVLLKKGCIFSVLNRTNIKVIPSNAFYYHFSKLINNKKYKKEQIDEIYNKIVS